MKDAREKLVQKDARFKIRGRGGAAAGGVQDARQMINSRKQGQSQSQFSSFAQTTLKAAITQQLQSKTAVPQIQIQTGNNLANARQFTTTIQGLIPQVSTTPQLSNSVRVMDARDRLSLKRSIGGTQTQTAAEPPLKITKTIQVRVQKVIIFFLVLTNPKSARSSSFNDYRLAFQQRPAGTLGGIRAMTQVHLFSFSIIQDIIYLQHWLRL